MLAADKIREWCDGKWLSQPSDLIIEELLIDTRKIKTAQTALFIALHISRRDGHQFIENAYNKGVRTFLVQQEVSTNTYPGAAFIFVHNTLAALQQFITTYRQQFSMPVIGITGSNGKTIVKEWLYQILANLMPVVRNPKSYNSQLGVPLSVWLLSKEYKLAIFEAGISKPGEMEKLERMIAPTIGIFTNIGEAHAEGFNSRRQKVREKLRLFAHCETLIYCKDYADIREVIQESSLETKLFTWSQYQPDADLFVKHVDTDGLSTTITALHHGHTVSVFIPFTDPASIENAVNCWCTLLLLKVDKEVIAEEMKNLQPVAMRLELKQGINGSTIINDTYNSDLTSLYIALDYLDQQKQHKKHTLILSDMLQMSMPDARLYEEVAEAIERKHIQRFIGVGPSIKQHAAIFTAKNQIECFFFSNTNELLQELHNIPFEQEAILLKGSRPFAFEKLSAILEQEVHKTILSIDLSALTENLTTFRNLVGPGVKVMSMVKAFSYGSGSYEIATMLQYAGVDYLTVAYTDEGIDLRKAGITLPIMVMSPDPGSFDRMIAWKLEPEIYNVRSLKECTRIAKALQVTDYPVHIKLDTGMHRLGFVDAECDDLVLALHANQYLKVASIFSHLAASEDASLDEFTFTQSANFERMSSKIMDALGYRPLRHLCNSAAIARHPSLHYDMVRLGLGLYGIDGSGLLKESLRQISTLKTTIAQIKRIPVGDTVGYNRRGVAEHEMSIATICIGYADGYPRALGNSMGHVLIKNKPAKIVGVVCMDMCMVDITEIPEAVEGDEVVVFSPELPLTTLAKWAGTIPYEIMTGISQRVKRVYVNEA